MTWQIQKKGQDRYLDFVRKINSDPEEFRQFRRNQDIRGIIDGVTPLAAKSYLKKIKQLDSEWISRHWSEIILNDLVGCPFRVDFGMGAESAPINMRYAWQALEIDRKLGIADKRVVEIGGGYGGLARMICALFSPKEYVIVDLPEVLDMTREYLRQYHLPNPIRFESTDSVQHADVFIANYSVAELDRAEQRKYLDNIILRSTSGYLVHNIPNPSSKQLSRKEFETSLQERFSLSSYVEAVERSEQSLVYICEPKDGR